MPTKHGWQRMWEQAKTLTGQAGLAAYDRAKLLTAIFNDTKFRDAHPTEDDHQLGDRLNELCEDLAMKFWRLKQLVEHFPAREQWAEGKLETMLATMLAERKAASDEGRQPATQHRVKRADYEKLADEKAHVESKLKHFEQMHSETVETKQQIIDRQATEIVELRRQLAVAEGRIAELERQIERVMDRELAAA